MKIIILIIIFVFLSFFIYPQLLNRWLGSLNFKFPERPFRLGLDLLGGAHLVYQADLTNIPEKEQGDSMVGVRDVIERRVNLYGVAEPNVQVSGNDRLIVELPQVKDVGEAIKLIGETPFLEFMELVNENFVSTGLNGKQLKRAKLAFDPNTNLPMVSLEFNDEGSKLLLEISKRFPNAQKIIDWVNKNSFKHHLPYTIE